MKKSIKILDGEYWYGGNCCRTDSNFFLDAKTEYTFDVLADANNQTASLLLSSFGRYIKTCSAFTVTVSRGVIEIDSPTAIEVSDEGTSLKEAYLTACGRYFPFSGKVPQLKFFETAQYNTWMEYDYRLNQQGVLDYAHKIVDNGYLPGILILDEGWHNHYGLWEFDKIKYPDAKAMIDALHSLGFVVMLWVVPYVTPDGYDFITARDKGLFLRTDDGDVALMRWWNGCSAVLNMNFEADRNYLSQKLDVLMKDYGVDGFKFDGGNVSAFAPGWVLSGKQTKYTAEELNMAWNDFGRDYEYHEYKDSFNCGGRAVIQRIRDRNHSWDDDGLNTLVPTAITQGLMGYPFICPDMIGGGEWTFNYKEGFVVDEELFVRMAQCSALFPMMQFSWGPWRVLSEDMQKIALSAAKLHEKFAPYIVSLVKNTAITGEPIIRCLEYQYPHCGYEKICDQFMLGDDVLVAPVLKKGEYKRKVVLPQGQWLYLGTTPIRGGTEVTVDAPIEVLPYFVRKSV